MASARGALWSTDLVPSAIGRQIKISERVASAIVDLVVEQNLQPGDRLPNEAEMIELFSVGRGSLREALRILETYGLISLRSGPGGGPVLLKANPRDVSRSFSLYLSLGRATLRELSEARMLIDPIAARLAAETLTDESAERLRSALEHERRSATGDTSMLVEKANDFHYVPRRRHRQHRDQSRDHRPQRDVHLTHRGRRRRRPHDGCLDPRGARSHRRRGTRARRRPRRKAHARALGHARAGPPEGTRPPSSSPYVEWG